MGGDSGVISGAAAAERRDERRNDVLASEFTGLGSGVRRVPDLTVELCTSGGGDVFMMEGAIDSWRELDER